MHKRKNGIIRNAISRIKSVRKGFTEEFAEENGTTRDVYAKQEEMEEK